MNTPQQPTDPAAINGHSDADPAVWAQAGRDRADAVPVSVLVAEATEAGVVDWIATQIREQCTPHGTPLTGDAVALDRDKRMQVGGRVCDRQTRLTNSCQTGPRCEVRGDVLPIRVVGQLDPDRARGPRTHPRIRSRRQCREQAAEGERLGEQDGVMDNTASPVQWGQLRTHALRQRGRALLGPSTATNAAPTVSVTARYTPTGQLRVIVDQACDLADVHDLSERIARACLDDDPDVAFSREPVPEGSTTTPTKQEL